MSRLLYGMGLALVILGIAVPAQASIKKDLANCTAGRDKSSASACTRVLKSGRLPKRQRYIAYYNRGWSYRNGGDAKRAVRDFTTALKYNSRFADSYYSRSVAHYDLGQIDRSIDDLDTYVERKGKSWLAHYKRALMFRRLDKHQRALDDLDTAASLKPSSKKVKILRALVLSDLEDHSKALSILQPVLAKAPKNADALHARALVLLRQKKYDDALTDVNKAIANRKSLASLYVLKGQILEETGSADAARASYRKARSYSAKSVETLFAGQLASERLAALEAVGDQQVVRTASSEKVIPPRPAPHSGSTTCRRFVPTANTTISIDCGD